MVAMAKENQMQESVKTLERRKSRKKKGNKGNKKQKQFLDMKEKRIDPKLKKLLRKKARDYNSEDDSEDGAVRATGDDNADSMDEDSSGGDKDDAMETRNLGIEIEGSDDEDDDGEEDGEIQPGITKLFEGCRAFKIAFRSIIKKSVSDDSLGPVLSGHKKLVAEKLAVEEAEKKVKGEAKKEKQMVAEKGHVKPATYLDAHEKFLISVATKGVVKLFNAVNKAQTAQKGLNPSRSKDAKLIKKRRKEAFFSELGKAPVADTSTKVNASSGEGPSWAPLRDNYMLTNRKFKDWDKKTDTVLEDDFGRMSEDSSSDCD